MMSGSMAAANASSTPSKGFTPYVFTHPTPGPLWVPPSPTASLLSLPPPILGTTRDFQIVLQMVKVTLPSAPRGDLTLTISSPFLQHWPTTAPVSYPFGLEFGCHWDELAVQPFVHDLYALYTRHLTLVLSVPSLAASNSQTNVAQTGEGSQVGSLSVALGSVCANIFDIVAEKTRENRQKGITQTIHPNQCGLQGDQGGYYFIEPLTNAGVFVGQIEARICFRYAGKKA